MQKKEHSVRFNFIMNFILTASAFVFPLITYPYVSRVLMPEGTGQVTFAVSIINYFIMFAMLGIPTYGIRACAQVRDDKELLSKTVHELMIINIAMSVICYIFLGISICMVSRFQEVRLLLWISSIGILLNAIGVNWFYQAIEEYAYITIRSLAFKVLSVIIMFLFIHSPEDCAMYAVMTLVASYGSYVLNFIRLKNYIIFKRFPKYDFMPHLKVAMVFFAMSIATTVYTNLDVVMLGFISGDAAVGHYNTAVKVKQLLVSLVTSLGAVLLPRLSYYVKNNFWDEFNRILGKTIYFVLYISIPLVVFFIIYARNVILILSSDLFLEAALPMQIIMPTLILIGLTNILGMQIMVPTGREKLVATSVAIGGVVDLIVDVVLIPQYGVVGAAIGNLSAEIIVLIVQSCMMKDVLGKLSIPPVWRMILAAGAAGFLTFKIIRIMTIPMLIVELAVAAVIFGCVYILTGVLLGDKIILQEVRNLWIGKNRE